MASSLDLGRRLTSDSDIVPITSSVTPGGIDESSMHPSPEESSALEKASLADTGVDRLHEAASVQSNVSNSEAQPGYEVKSLGVHVQAARTAARQEVSRRRRWAGKCFWAVMIIILIVGPRLAGTLTTVLHSRETNARNKLRDAAYQSPADGMPRLAQRQATTSSAPTSLPTVLECFQVAEPVLTPQGAQSSSGGGAPVTTNATDSSPTASCQVLLMDHVFGNSYGTPFVGQYTPPDCDFNRVVIDFVMVSQGRQYDRLALMYLGDTEVWRTSTAEPTKPPGIREEYLKDMTQYLSLWKEPQMLIFDLGNIVNNVYTGYLNTTMTATFFMSDVVTDTAPPSDLVIPISKRQGSAGQASAFNVPDDNATNTITLPRNANRAVLSVSSCGQGAEEFWWGNIPLSDANAFNSSDPTILTAGPLPAYSPWREVEVLIDGKLAGVQWPFPVIFTGGVVPSIHRPIVGIDDFDLREHEIDITPFLPYLSDGHPHTFTLQVAGLKDNGKTCAKVISPIEASWILTGKIFLWLDDESSVTTGSAPSIQAPEPSITVSQTLTQDARGNNETLTYYTAVKRTFSTSAQVKSQHSSSVVTWTQDLSYSNQGFVYAYGFDENTVFALTGTDTRTGGGTAYRSSYNYPLECNSTYTISSAGDLTITAEVEQGQDLRIVGAAVYPTGLEAFEGGVSNTKGSKYPGGSLLTTRLNGVGGFFQTADGSNSSGFGTTMQVFSFGAENSPEEAGIGGSPPDIELYYRDVTATNGMVVFDQERVAGTAAPKVNTAAPSTSEFGGARGLFAQIPENGGHGPRPFRGRQAVRN
jgi:hypothetical protein